MKKRLRIAQVSPLWYTVPPKKYGGVEKIVAYLADGLTKKGHEVTLFAPPGSKTEAKNLVSIFRKPLREAGVSWDNKYWDLMNLSEAVRRAGQGAFDIVHNHIDAAEVFFSGLNKIPVISTIHNGIYFNKQANEYYKTRYEILKAGRNNLSVVFISKALKNLVGFNFKKSRVIYNGIDTKKFAFNEKPDDYFLWVGRIEKKKGIENAIEAVSRVGGRLIIAGRIDEISKQYFTATIKPKLSKKIRYISELNENELADFYGNARAFLYPIEWEEPFGLVVAEAMACGTPVIAYRRGSMEELIKNGKSGFVIDSDIKKLTEAMGKIDQIDRGTVRKHTEDNFSEKRMVDEYEKFYYELSR